MSINTYNRYPRPFSSKLFRARHIEDVRATIKLLFFCGKMGLVLGTINEKLKKTSENQKYFSSIVRIVIAVKGRNNRKKAKKKSY